MSTSPEQVGMRFDEVNGKLVEVEPPPREIMCIQVPAHEAQTALWTQRPAGIRGNEIWINMGAGGLGDSLLALCAIKGFKRQYPDRTVIYRIHRNKQPFVALFDGGYDGLAAHTHDETKYDYPPDADPRDWQINAGYAQELNQCAQLTRIERYCRNIGVLRPEIPELRDPEPPETTAKQYKGYVALCPFASWMDREYSLHAWAHLERLLKIAGYRTVVVAADHNNPERVPVRTNLFQGEIVANSSVDMTTGIMRNAGIVVSNDSGLAHLAAIQGTQTLVLCGWSVGKRIYNFYPRVECLQGQLWCTGCWTNPPLYDKYRCSGGCANLNSIDPERILKAIVTRLGRDP